MSLTPGADVTVSRILIHPIKSCRGTSVQVASYDAEGMENDRKWSIIDATSTTIITARESPKMVLIHPRVVVDKASPFGGVLSVSFPEESGCETLSIPLKPTPDVLQSWTMLLSAVTLWKTHDPVDGYIGKGLPDSPDPSTVLSKYFEKPVHLIYKGPRPRSSDVTTAFPNLKATAHFQDMYPLLLFSEESVSMMEEKTRDLVGVQGVEDRWKSEKLTVERFRPNIVIQGGGPFAEDKWEEVVIGDKTGPKITLVSKCTRCLLPNVSPQTGERDKAVPYKVMLKFRAGLDPEHKFKPCAGCNGVPEGEGVVRVGDVVHVTKAWKEL